jgi:hypothetical protein
VTACSLLAACFVACGATRQADSAGAPDQTAGAANEAGHAGAAPGGAAGASHQAGSGGSAVSLIQIGTAGSGGVLEQPEDPLPMPHGAQPCDNPQPYAEGGGYLVCEDKSLRVGERSACPTTLPRAMPTEPLFYEQCALDVDCTAAAHGFCAYGQCQYGCVSDDECAADELCFCGADVGQCLRAGCRSDADCPAAYPCTGNLPFGTTNASFQCQTPLDTCESDYDCPGPRSHCVGNRERRYCVVDIVG